MIAYYRRRGKKPVTNPTLYEGELRHVGETWVASRQMGERSYRVIRLYPTGIVPDHLQSPNEVYDLRIVSQEDESVIREFDAAIAKLQSQRTAFVKDRFRTWRIPTREDCISDHPGKSRETAQAEATQLNSTERLSVREAQREKRVVRRLNDAIGW